MATSSTFTSLVRNFRDQLTAMDHIVFSPELTKPDFIVLQNLVADIEDFSVKTTQAELDLPSSTHVKPLFEVKGGFLQRPTFMHT